LASDHIQSYGLGKRSTPKFPEKFSVSVFAFAGTVARSAIPTRATDKFALHGVDPLIFLGPGGGDSEVGAEILVNNAAHQASFKSIADITDHEWEHTFKVNIQERTKQVPRSDRAN
jgi:hypothetical protein